MTRKTLVYGLFLLTLTALGGCIIHDPGYYPSHRGYYHSYYYGPYLYAPFWFGGYYFYDDSHRGHRFFKDRGFDRRGGGRWHR